jgi:hypothetical protein
MMLVLEHCFTLRYQHLLEIRIRFFYVNHLMMSSKTAFSLSRLSAESWLNGESRFYIYIARQLIFQFDLLKAGMILKSALQPIRKG